MTDKITVHRETWDAMREALEHIQRCIGFDKATIHQGSATWCEIDDAITAANAVSDHFRGVTEMVQPLGWYCVSRDGLATQCADQRDAEMTAKSANRDWPNSAPYRAVQLCEFEANPQATEPAWRPIETAPKGEKGYSWMLLAWGPEEDKSTGYGMNVDGKFYASATFYCLGQDRLYQMREIEVNPTHWMPLPAAPEAKQ